MQEQQNFPKWCEKCGIAICGSVPAYMFCVQDAGARLLYEYKPLAYVIRTAKISRLLTPHSSVTAQSMLMKLETYCRKTTQHPKQYFDRMTSVVWANTVFPLYRKVSFFVFL